MAELSLEEARRLLGLPTPPPAEQLPPMGQPVTQVAPAGGRPLEVTIRPQAPPIGPESVGAPGAIVPPVAPAPAPVPTAPLEVTTADTSRKPSEGLTDLDVMAHAMWQQESGDRHIDPKTGKVIRSSAGAIGVSQLMPKTAEGLGVDPFDEKQNRIGGKRYLAQMFEKYGNWRDALGAYFAGPGNYDKWLDGGSKRGTELGKQITAYQDSVLARAGIIERGETTPPERSPSGNRLLSMEDARALMSLPPQTAEEAEARARQKRDREGGTFLEESTDRAKALAYSLYKGARDFEFALPQAVLEQVSPDNAKLLTEKFAEADAPWKSLTSKHSYISTAGEIIGGTTALLATARLLGPPAAAGARMVGLTTVLKDIAPRVPWLLNAHGSLTTAGRYAVAVPTGAAITAGTTFTESADPSARLWLGALGAIAGPLGVSFGQGLAKIMTTPVRKSEQAAMMQALKDNAELLSNDLNHLKNVAVTRISKMETEASNRYVKALGTGQLVRGLDADVLNSAIQGYKTKAASQIEQTKRQLVERLGLDKEMQKVAQAAVQRQQYDDQVRAVARAQEEYIDKYIARSGDQNARQQIRATAAQSDPAFPQVSMAAPEAYMPGVVSAESFMKGRQFLREELRRATTRAKRNQIRGLEGEFNKAFAAAAKDSGLSAGQFYRRLRVADAFYKKNVVPAHDLMSGWFGKRFRGSEQIADDPVNKLTQGLDAEKIFEKVVDTIESGTKREVDAMMHVFGTTPADKEWLVRSIAYRALTKAEGGIGKEFDPLVVKKYIDDNHHNLARVMTPEQYRWMEGFAKVTEGLAERMKQSIRDSDRGFWGSSRILNILGLERFGRGEYVHGAKLIVSGIFAHTLVNSLPQMRDAVLSRIIGKMAHLKVGSPEYEKYFARLEYQWAKRAIVGVRAAGDLSGAGEKPVPAFQPLQAR